MEDRATGAAPSRLLTSSNVHSGDPNEQRQQPGGSLRYRATNARWPATKRTATSATSRATPMMPIMQDSFLRIESPPHQPS
jgi:hypothetical protein